VNKIYGFLEYETSVVVTILYIYIYIYLYIYIYKTAIGLTSATQNTPNRTYEYITITKLNMHNNKSKYNIKKLIDKCEPCPVFASYTLAFALQLRKKHGKTSARVVSRTTQADSVQ
jgi:hypothetical protein